ncbi:MAG TPA: Bax inhibitor-1 family protein [Gaiellaceae bacterium]
MTMSSIGTAPSQPLTHDEAGSLLGQTMGLVACTAGFFALGAYLGRNTSGGWTPQALWQAGGATALFIAGFGAAGYATRRVLSGLARGFFWALIGLIVFGIVLIFVQIPHGSLIYAIAGLVIFAGLTLFDFQRLRRSQDIRTAPLLAASIFLDVLNVFLLFLQIFSNDR